MIIVSGGARKAALTRENTLVPNASQKRINQSR
jgi:hypothetical protein